jgi:hypothetical protein
MNNTDEIVKALRKKAFIAIRRRLKLWTIALLPPMP